MSDTWQAANVKRLLHPKAVPTNLAGMCTSASSYLRLPLSTPPCTISPEGHRGQHPQQLWSIRAILTANRTDQEPTMAGRQTSSFAPDGAMTEQLYNFWRSPLPRTEPPSCHQESSAKRCAWSVPPRHGPRRDPPPLRVPGSCLTWDLNFSGYNTRHACALRIHVCKFLCV